MEQWEIQAHKWKTLIQSYVLSRLEASTGSCKSKEDVQLLRPGGETEVHVKCEVQERLIWKS